MEGLFALCEAIKELFSTFELFTLLLFFMAVALRANTLIVLTAFLTHAELVKLSFLSMTFDPVFDTFERLQSLKTISLVLNQASSILSLPLDRLSVELFPSPSHRELQVFPVKLVLHGSFRLCYVLAVVSHRFIFELLVVLSDFLSTLLPFILLLSKLFKDHFPLSTFPLLEVFLLFLHSCESLLDLQFSVCWDLARALFSIDEASDFLFLTLDVVLRDRFWAHWASWRECLRIVQGDHPLVSRRQERGHLGVPLGLGTCTWCHCSAYWLTLESTCPNSCIRLGHKEAISVTRRLWTTLASLAHIHARLPRRLLASIHPTHPWGSSHPALRRQPRIACLIVITYSWQSKRVVVDNHRAGLLIYRLLSVLWGQSALVISITGCTAPCWRLLHPRRHLLLVTLLCLLSLESTLLLALLIDLT